jgi:hypothetical protein
MNPSKNDLSQQLVDAIRQAQELEWRQYVRAE